MDLVEEHVRIGDVELSILRPPDAEALLDEEAFEREEFLPYWAELWPSGVLLAQEVATRRLSGLRVVELGCGLGLPSLVAALAGAGVLATDWAPDAIDLLRRNAERTDAGLETLVCSWSAAGRITDRGPFDLVLAADVLYERRNADQLLGLLPQLVDDGEVVLADPGRPHLRTFLDGAASGWDVERHAKPARESANLAVYHLRRRT